MNKTQDVILGVLSGPNYGFKYPGVESYIVSINRSGFAGRKVMIVWNIHPETRRALVVHGFEVVDLSPWPPDRFFHARMRVAWEYMRDHYKEFRYCFWLDIKDLLLQSDPSLWMEQNIGKAQLVGSTECTALAECETNNLWIRTIFGDKVFNQIGHEETINGGTWAGYAEPMMEVFHRVHNLIKDYGGPYPPCQAGINVALHTDFKSMLYIPRWEKGFAACMHPFWSPWRVPMAPYLRDKPPVLDLRTCVLYPGIVSGPNNKAIPFNGNWGQNKDFSICSASAGPMHCVECVENSQNRPFSILHGYDRDWNLKEMFEFKYRFDQGDWNLQKFKEYKELMVPSYQREFKRGLRRPEAVMAGARLGTQASARQLHRRP
jgi:hypothetical protein